MIPAKSATGHPAQAWPNYWIVFSLCLALLVFRGWDRIAHPELFAEGFRFVGQAFSDGWWSVLVPYDFFFHTVPRLIAIVAVSVIPVEHIPLFTNFSCYALTAAAIANVSRPGYQWLIPSPHARVLLPVLFVMAPGLHEYLGNLAGIHWALLLWLATLCLKDPEQPYRIWELCLFAVIILTVGAAIVFLPLAFLRVLMAWVRSNQEPQRWAFHRIAMRREFALFAMLFLVSAFLVLHFVLKDTQVGAGDVDIVARMRGVGDLLRNLGFLFTGFYFLHPFLGTQHMSLFLGSVPFFPLFGVALVLVGILLWRLTYFLSGRTCLVLAWLFCLFLLAIMLSFVRYWSFYGVFAPPYWNWWFRYNFIFATSGLLFWFILLRPVYLNDLKSWSSVATLVLFLSYMSQVNVAMVRAFDPHKDDRFAIKRYGDERYWSRSAEVLEKSVKTGCPVEVQVRGYPGGRWDFVYTSSKSPEECAED